MFQGADTTQAASVSPQGLRLHTSHRRRVRAVAVMIRPPGVALAAADASGDSESAHNALASEPRVVQRVA